MQSRRLGLGMAVIGVAVAVVLFLVLREDETESEAPAPAPGLEAPPGEEEAQPRPVRPAVATIELRGGEPVGGVQRLTFRRGERIQFVVRSDSDEELHLHGYDVVEDVEAGGRARFDLLAELEGIYELETHEGHATIAEVAVRP